MSATTMTIPVERRVAAIDSAGRATIVRQPVPRPKPGQVLVRVRASLISPGTELAAARAARASGTPAASSAPPRPFGYQNAGEVVALGEGVDRLVVGQRVACMGGGYALHSDWIVVPQNMAVPMPDNVTFEQAAYGHLAITALHAVRRATLQIGENVLVVGLGVVGQLAAQFAKVAGANVVAWDMLDLRVQTARRCGIDAIVSADEEQTIAESRRLTDDLGFDAAFLAVGGDGTALLQRVKKVMTHLPDGHAVGRVVLVGGLVTNVGWGAGMGNLNLLSSARTGPGYHDDDWEHGRRDYPPVLVRWSTADNLRLALRLMGNGALRVDELTTHRAPLERVDEMIAAHLDRPEQTIGTVLLMDE